MCLKFHLFYLFKIHPATLMKVYIVVQALNCNGYAIKLSACVSIFGLKKRTKVFGHKN